MKKKYFKIFILILFFLLINLLSGYIHYNLRLSEKFGDEIFHFYGGHLVLKGIKLYQQVQVNHQPIPHLLSAFSEIFFSQYNLYTFIARHREMVFIYSFIWNLINFVFFGKIALITIALFESLKFYFQGYKNLQETLVSYPLIFLITDVLFLSFNKKDSVLRKIFFSIALFFAVFSFLPTWFACGLLFFSRFVMTKKNKFILLLPFLILTSLMGTLIPYTDYLIETIYNNLFFYVPNSAYGFNLIKIALLPFGVFFAPYNNQKLIIGILVVLFFYQLFLLIKSKKFKIAFFLVVLLYLTNFLQVDEFKFNSFHLLQWVASLISLTVSLSFLYLKKFISSWRINFIHIILILISLFFLIDNDYFIKKKDFNNEFYVNYSPSETYGRVISLLKDKNDQLFVYSNDPLIYYSSGILPSTKVVEYYTWIFNIPKYKKEVLDLFNSRMPEFVVNLDLNKNQPIEGFILNKLEKHYVNLQHVNKSSHLYINKEKLKEINFFQKKQANDLLFSF